MTDPSHPDPHAQTKYQVRFDWGSEGLRRVVPGAHVVVLVDALSFTTTVVAAAEHEVAVAPWGDDPMGAEALADELGGRVAVARDDDGPSLSPSSYSGADVAGLVVLASPNGGALARLLADVASDVVVLAASLGNRTAVAERVLALQEERGERTIVAVLAAGERDDPGWRAAIEDELVGGAVVDALVGLGIDHTSPEAAVACAAYEGLQHAAVHLIGASASGAELVAKGFRDDVRIATQRDTTKVVPELVDGVFRTALPGPVVE